MGLGEGAGVGVAQLDDVAEDLVEGADLGLPLRAGPARQALQLRHERLELAVRLPIHQAVPLRELARPLGRGARQVLVLLEGLADRTGGLVDRSVELARALVERAK